MSAQTQRWEMEELRAKITRICSDIRDHSTAGWCAAAMHLYGRLGLRLLVQEAYERGDFAEHRRLVAVLIRAERAELAGERQA